MSVLSAKRPWRYLWLLLCAIIAIGSWVTRQAKLQQHQAQLDAQILTVAENGTVPQAQKLLAQGAQADARRRSNAVTLWEPLLNIRTRLEYRDYPFQIGYTPLMLASIRGDRAMVIFLLGQGANPRASECIDGKGATPVSLAKDYGHPDIVSLLKQAGSGEPPMPQETHVFRE
ncbi:ankyrin repeat domain-containing protein [Armatimonas sp.]|uniref:ankyrin repeat domain-containing protein n=1 Tax=Armatimonas sp. TaxID=1872638 RepID=UPI00286A6E19|nr:ankyrin repeat domain-containing protein [Armatimonas sp.]